MIKQYKRVCRSIRRLPVDTKTLEHVQNQAKNEFSRKYINTKRLRNYQALLDDIVMYENWPRLFSLFDDLYRSRLTAGDFPQLYSTFHRFQNVNYDDVRHIYPHVHLFHELDAPEPFQHRFNNSLEQEEDVISVLALLKHNGSDLTLPLRALEEPQSGHDTMIDEIKKLYQFVAKNDKLTHLKLLPFEVTYPSDKFGFPLHIIQRDKLLKDHLKYVKYIISRFQPVNKLYLDQLAAVSNYEIGLNQNFFKYMIKKRTIMPAVVNLKTNKSVIPDLKNIIKWYKEYLTKQFYVDKEADNYVYRLYPINFYS